jgi:hypothetical protein
MVLNGVLAGYRPVDLKEEAVFHTIGNVCRVLSGRPTKEKPPKARLVDFFADPGGDWTANRLLNEKAQEEEKSSS